ncbi:hypothetical protein [Kitasatospora cineracea]|uniref:hypothetical protein n=1 Tax=Kitasatospora cineracea TaxID=88074 RepID=UPI0036DDD211
MRKRTARSFAVALITLASAVGTLAAPASAAAPTHREGALDWTYDAPNHRIIINDTLLFVTELCTGASGPCANTATKCANQFHEVSGGWATKVNRYGQHQCPQTGGLPGSALRTAMNEVIPYWNAQ